MSKSNTTFKSPFATSFNNACKRGTPFCTAVQNIAKRTGKNESTIWNSLYKAGLVWRQKFNGQWIYFPCNWEGKANASNKKSSQFNMWQCFIEYCVVNGFCTPEALKKHCGSQSEFESYCKKFWNKQFSGSKKSSASKGRKRPSVKRSSRNTSTASKKRTTTNRKRKSTRRAVSSRRG